MRLLQTATLVSVAPDGQPQPGLAQRWDRSSDGLSIRLYLRPGLTFHDGTPLTAAALRELLEPTPSADAAAVVPGLRDIASVEVPLPDVLVIRLKEPTALLLEALAFVPVTGGRDGSSAAGPFIVDRQDAGGAALRAFDGYFRGRPSVDGVALQVYGSRRAAWGAMMRGEVDALYEVAPEAVEFVEAGADVFTSSFLRPYVYFLGFNLEHPVLRRREVRTALTRAVDRPMLIEGALGGRGLVASGHVWPRHWAHDASVTAPTFDPARTMRELDEAALPVRRGLAGDVAPSRFRITALVPGGYPTLERLGLLVQKQMADAGVDVALEALPLAELQRRLRDGRFDAYLLELAAWQGLNWPYWFWRSSDGAPAWVASGYRGADEALDRVRRAPTDIEFAAGVREFQRTLASDPPGLFLCWSEMTRAVRLRFEVPPDRDRDIMAALPQWRLARGDSRP